jgi:hypothetical protein
MQLRAASTIPAPPDADDELFGLEDEMSLRAFGIPRHSDVCALARWTTEFESTGSRPGEALCEAIPDRFVARRRRA